MKKTFLILSSSTLLFTGCVKQEQVDALQKELIELKKQLSQIQKEQQEMKEDLSRLSQRVDNVAKVASENQMQIQKMKSFGTEEGTKQTGEKQPHLKKEGAEKVKLPEKPDELYRYGLDAYYKGKIEEAREIFEEFTRRYRDSELYDNALFWIGQTYYTEGKYDTAVKIFDRIINGCKTGKILDCNKLPTAMLKKGYALSKMGEFQQAKKVFRQLIEKFPDTEEAEIAQKKLEVSE
ncbi:tetratricopeptide repeat protein [Persephonella sp.]